MTFKQTWWDDNLETQMESFKSWIGDSNEQSKVYLRKHIKDSGYKQVIDLGCGLASEFFALKEEQPDVNYLGIDSSIILFNKNTELGVPMINASAEETTLQDGYSEFVFSRHVLEHQPDFRPILSEMIRISSKEALHIFFISPGDNPEHIGYEPTNNLYHNRYNKVDIEKFLKANDKVKSFTWNKINETETALHVKII